MADYYPLIARAITGLDPSAPGESRRALYQRARAALIAQLRSVEPPLSESQITRERLSLEEAVRKVESEAAQRARDAARSGTWPAPGLRVSADADDLGRAAAQANRAAQSRVTPAPSSADQTLAKMAERLEAAIRRPAAMGGILRVGLDADAVEGVEEKIRRPLGPPLNAIPEQDLRRAMGFSPTRTGPLDLVPDPPTDPYDQEQSLLYARIRRQLSKLKQDIPSQERSQVNDAIDDFLEQPAEWSKVENKKILWLCGNSLRALLAQSDSVKGDSEHYSKLPPSVAEGMRHPVQAWSIFVQGDPAMAVLDKYSLGPQEQQSVLNNLAAVERIVSKTVEDRNLLTQNAALAINATMKSASSTSKDINTKLAQELADNTSKNLFNQILRRAYLLRDAIIDPSSPAEMEIRLSFAKGAAQAAGGIALTAALTGVAHAFPYFEFVATNPMIVKEYILVAFQNSQMSEVVDAIEFEYNRLR
jgi:hypothetical protein